MASRSTGSKSGKVKCPRLDLTLPIMDSVAVSDTSFHGQCG